MCSALRFTASNCSGSSLNISANIHSFQHHPVLIKHQVKSTALVYMTCTPSAVTVGSLRHGNICGTLGMAAGISGPDLLESLFYRVSVPQSSTKITGVP